MDGPWQRLGARSYWRLSVFANPRLVQSARLQLALLDPQVAREYGVADLDDNGEWVVGDVSRLSSD